MRASGKEQDMSSRASICAFQPLSHEPKVVHEPPGHFVRPSLQNGRAVTIGEAIKSGTGVQGTAHKNTQLAFEITESRSCSTRKSNLCSTGETARSSFRIPLYNSSRTYCSLSTPMWSSGGTAQPCLPRGCAKWFQGRLGTQNLTLSLSASEDIRITRAL